MAYSPLTKYSNDNLKSFPPEELQMLFEEAKRVSLEVRGVKMVRKILKDISNMRRLLNGFDNVYNERH